MRRWGRRMMNVSRSRPSFSPAWMVRLTTIGKERGYRRSSAAGALLKLQDSRPRRGKRPETVSCGGSDENEPLRSRPGEVDARSIHGEGHQAP